MAKRITKQNAKEMSAAEIFLMKRIEGYSKKVKPAKKDMQVKKGKKKAKKKSKKK